MCGRVSLSPLIGKQTCDEPDQFRRLDGFGKMFIEARVQGALTVLGPGERGEGGAGNRARGRVVGAAQISDEAVTIFAGHGDVAHDSFGFFFDGAPEAVGGVFGHAHQRAALGQHPMEIRARVRFVVDDEQPAAGKRGA